MYTWGFNHTWPAAILFVLHLAYGVCAACNLAGYFTFDRTLVAIFIGVATGIDLAAVIYFFVCKNATERHVLRALRGIRDDRRTAKERAVFAKSLVEYKVELCAIKNDLAAFFATLVALVVIIGPAIALCVNTPLATPAPYTVHVMELNVTLLSIALFIALGFAGKSYSIESYKQK